MLSKRVDTGFFVSHPRMSSTMNATEPNTKAATPSEPHNVAIAPPTYSDTPAVYKMLVEPNVANMNDLQKILTQREREKIEAYIDQVFKEENVTATMKNLTATVTRVNDDFDEILTAVALFDSKNYRCKKENGSPDGGLIDKFEPRWRRIKEVAILSNCSLRSLTSPFRRQDFQRLHLEVTRTGYSSGQSCTRSVSRWCYISIGSHMSTVSFQQLITSHVAWRYSDLRRKEDRTRQFQTGAHALLSVRPGR